jgi:thioredoxin 1
MSTLKEFWAPQPGGDVVELVQRPNEMKGVVILKIFASWCPHCQEAAPVFRSYALKNVRVVFAELEYEKNPEPVEGVLSVTAYPTFVLFRDGKQEETFTGFSEDKLKHMVQQAQSMLIDGRGLRPL